MAELEFGIAVHPEPDPHGLVDAAGRAESLGYDRFWIPDQSFLADPFLMAGRVAERHSIPVGIGLASPFSRHPVQIARAMATLVRLDDVHRSWVLALGKGNSNLVLRPLGFESGATTARLVAALDLVKRLLAGEEITEPVPGFTTAPVSLGADTERIPVFVGTRGPRTLEAAGPVADGFITESLFLPELVAWARRAAGLGPGDRRAHVAWQAVVILDEGEAIPVAARRFAALLMRTTAQPVLELLGVDPELRARVAARALRDGDLGDDDVRRFVAVGTVEQLRTRILDAARAGVTSWSSMFVGDAPTAEAAMARFADEVVRPVRAALADLPSSDQKDR